jgi:hypothetical protein
MLKALVVAAAIIAGFSVARAQTSVPDCSRFAKFADGNSWKLFGPIDWPPYMKSSEGSTMIVRRHGMFVNGQNFFDVIEKACGKH